MTRVRWRMLGMVVGLVLLPISGLAQRQPNLSGHWELVEALATGPGRDGTVSEKPRPTTSTTISGAPFNCGRGCTITQKGQTLTIENAQLADIPGRDKTHPPSMTFPVNGRQTKVVDSYNWDPPRELPVTARWDGNKVRIETVDHGAMATLTWTQLLSLENGQLVVVTTSTRDGESRWGTTFRYRRSSRR
jgi:hypothetical protein